MDNIYEIFAKNLRDRRCKLGYSQAILGDMLQYSEKSISKWESGTAIPSVEVLIKLTQILGTDLNTILGFNSRISFYLGVDGGATKTAFALADEGGHIIRTLKLGPCNPFDIGMREAQQLLEDGINEVCNGISRQTISAFIGISGGMSGGNKNIFTNFFEKFSFGRCINDSDAKNAIATALHWNDGIAVIIGTGNVVYTVYNREMQRIGGYGYLLDKGGNGFSIGRDCIHSALRQLDGSGRNTVMTSIVEKHIGGNIIDNLNDIYNNGKAYIASFAPFVFDAHSKGDRVATEILENNFRYLADQISAGFKGRWKKDDKVSVAMVGGLVVYEQHIRPILERALSEFGNIELKFYRDEPVLGALMLAGAPIFEIENSCEKTRTFDEQM